MNYNNDFKYDLALGQLGEGFIGKMLSDKTIEVKFDFACHKTGNFYIEYSSRGKLSGIATTESDYWMLIASTESGDRLKTDLTEIKESDVMFSIMVSTEKLRRICREKYYRKDVKGGDNNTSLGVLIRKADLLGG